MASPIVGRLSHPAIYLGPRDIAKRLGDESRIAIRFLKACFQIGRHLFGSTEMVSYVARRTEVPVVGVGGVATARDAYEKIRAGASVVQLYTGLVYQGPTVARDINRGLVELLERDGFDAVEDAVGAEL